LGGCLDGRKGAVVSDGHRFQSGARRRLPAADSRLGAEPAGKDALQSREVAGKVGEMRVHVWIRGRVQGVFFRAYTRDEAVRRGLSGWVRNLPDRRVEAVFEGDPGAVERMLAWCRRGSPGSRVDHVEVIEESPVTDLRDFKIRY
jgi:acylphosphatase